MSQTIITKAFESYKAQQEALLQSVELNEFVLANVPNLDPSQPIDREAGVPEAHIVHVCDVHQSGYINPNAVVYSITLDTTVGDFAFNWIGLRNKQSGVLCAVTHLLPISKYQSVVGVQNGNAITRSILMSYVGAQQTTGITVDASTWQIDFTARLHGIDEAERLSNRDHYGVASFFADGFEVYRHSGQVYSRQGLCYIEGVRSERLDNTLLTIKPSTVQYVYVDTSWQGHITGRWQSVVELIVSDDERAHYVDTSGFLHYLSKVATIEADGTIIDERQVLMEFEPKLNAATNAEIDSRSSALKHIKLPQFWHALMGYAQSNHAHDDDYYLKAQVDSRLAGKVDKSSVTDSTSSTSSILVASAKAIKTVKDLAQSKWTYVTATVSRYGAVLLSNSYTGTSQTKAVTEKALRDGLATKSSSGHAHDEDYYLKAQLDSKLADKLSKTAKATLTDNDGHGNANLVGNHQGGIPQQDGSSYRVEMGTDTNVANLSIELGDSVRAGIAKALTTVLYLCTSYIDSKVDLRERGARVFSPNNRNISSQTDGSNDLIYASQKAVGDSSRNGSTKHYYNPGNITLRRHNSRFHNVQCWGTSPSTISIQTSDFWAGDEIEIANVREDSGALTITNLDGSIYLPDNSNAASHTLTGRGRVVLRKHNSGYSLMVTSISG
ncbi:TPA: phage tail protein [Vibrio parahaemolyticus]|uniref:phage tail-collar fiber domain-containing protein n=1 Tax=Vibrio parahaemolyticus TaxID=670 RepID=UPI000A3CAC04|nr:phage tail protein [Vibrio parahaemolyticus]EJE8523629.1 phage tail protein [Vibrio parahaemolyticus]ELS9502400.1 phage tail protein [Vibrio parahaemolyticus]MBE3878330.1 phage tail protein [Vibrio parahaemolyticus]MBE4371074.1 phage tail protein [Vibrio parahaemolyticus]MBE5114895.1 phage tail protein [Vibrio parahaemolyticus]